MTTISSAQPPGPDVPSLPDQQQSAQLLARIAAGDETAWKPLVQRYRRVVRTRAFRLGLDAHEVQDVEQRVWVKLWAHAGRIRDPRCLPGWISTTARREAMLVAAGRRQQPDSLDAHPGLAARHTEPGAGCDPLDVLITKERTTALQRAIRQLPPRQRELVRAVVDELSYQEISRRLAMPVGSIGPTRARAVQRLRGALASSAAASPVRTTGTFVGVARGTAD